MSRPRLELITTAYCSRCDEALDWLASMPELRGFALLAREVTANDALFERYAARVPVLLVDGDEFDWPFDLQRLRGKL